MSGDGQLENEPSVPAELRRKSLRRFRLSAWNAYSLIGTTIMSALLLAFVIHDFSTSAKISRAGRELASYGLLASTADVRTGGLHSATVFYSFTYNGSLYRGQALLPRSYLDKVLRCEKTGDFPVLFLPRDPSVNHPYDWRDDESPSTLSYIFIVLMVIQWSVLMRSVFRDLRPPL